MTLLKLRWSASAAPAPEKFGSAVPETAAAASTSPGDDRSSRVNEALAEVRRHERKLLGYIRRRQHDPSHADDILQETILVMMQQAQKREIENPLAYAYRVAESLIYAQARRGRREEGLDDHEFICDAPLADEVLEHRQRVVLFQAALQELSPLRRDIFLRRHLHGQSRQTIAEDLGITLEAVKKHLVRAMIELSRSLPQGDAPALETKGGAHGA